MTRGGGANITPATGFDAFVERYAEKSAEALWVAALALLERAAVDARATPGRWRAYPAGELRRLRRELVPALLLARVAVALQEEDNDLVFELTREARQRTAAADRGRRRSQTREAERVRLLRAAAKHEGRELTDEERFPWLSSDGEAP